jgi:tetratricopeptide (TPR) repeat protein
VGSEGAKLNTAPDEISLTPLPVPDAETATSDDADEQTAGLVVKPEESAVENDDVIDGLVEDISGSIVDHAIDQFDDEATVVATDAGLGALFDQMDAELAKGGEADDDEVQSFELEVDDDLIIDSTDADIADAIAVVDDDESYELDGSGLFDGDEEFDLDFGEAKGAAVGDIDDDDARTHFDLGIAFKEMGQTKKSLEQFGMISDSSPLRPESLRFTAEIFRDKNQLDDAVDALEDALTSPSLNDEARAPLYYDLHLTHMAAGRKEAAIEALQAVADAGLSDFADVTARLDMLKS